MTDFNPHTTKTHFFGEGFKLFGILIINVLLMIITLGLYYPWAKAALMRYYYKETEFAGSRFTFHGTGTEMFIGFLKAIGIFILIVGTSGIVSYLTNVPALGVIIFYLAFLALIPFAIHGSLRYRMSRTSWRGIHGGYRGKLSELVMLYFKGLLLTIVTLGIYAPWFTVELRKYIAHHSRLGSVEFEYTGNGFELLVIHLKGIIFIPVTLGIYIFWYAKNVTDYYINHLHMHQKDKVSTWKSEITVEKIFFNFLINLTIPFTLGLSLPWVIIANFRLLFNNVRLEGDFNPDEVEQTEQEYRDATGEDLLDALDIDFA